MRKIVWLLLAAVASFAAVADEDGTRFSGEELKTLVTGATVEHVTKSGSLRRWKNDADGSFMVTTDNKKYGNALGQQSVTRPGTWLINDGGKYCVEFDWQKREPEKWCAFIIKGADGGYYLNSVDPARKIKFSK
ncbi:MAG: DUF995 domain-containing protein [Candidatus Dechloromonas phosphoritropha]|jgi:hypothetical protein|nr:DUF995 domain-containing protein [Candidatus Dechloromonas phosphoritropha]MBP8787587.1 DUF995 domain-containing protein [Azonexus sp.]MBP9228135.1 DUF995 domain-containing protein [Azonexus sp.]